MSQTKIITRMFLSPPVIMIAKQGKIFAMSSLCVDCSSTRFVHNCHVMKKASYLRSRQGNQIYLDDRHKMMPTGCETKPWQFASSDWSGLAGILGKPILIVIFLFHFTNLHHIASTCVYNYIMWVPLLNSRPILFDD